MAVEEFGARVRAARAYAGITQGELGDRLQVTSKVIQRLETGKRAESHLTEGAQRVIAREVADACNLPPDWILEGFDEPSLARLESRVGDLATLLERLQRAVSAIELRLARGDKPGPRRKPVVGNGDGDVDAPRRAARARKVAGG